MKKFKYILDKSSKKFICPKCHKKTFVKFIESETGNYLSEDFGRCDRETNCSYYNSPEGNQIHSFEKNQIPKLQTSYHNIDLLKQSLRDYSNNNFIAFLEKIFSSDKVKIAIENYKIGTSKNWQGSTVFWQIDNLNRIHAGKILQYNPITGKRIKDENNKALINWVHSILKRRRQLENFNLSQCLFGLHLIRQNTKKVAIVESEKTAIIMSLFKPQYYWLATGNKQAFKYEMLNPVKEFEIIAFPDKSEYKDWNLKAIELNKIGFRIHVSKILEHTNYPTGFDLADLITFHREKEKLFNNST
ncbi:hypothetical protein SAMN06265349_102893 [Flavobacterium resistens]|uniref:Uncharacterized protein n=1 Tax=Flavobacterium resistens TaxID=443612 RepID=A0A521CTD4_9FLAO|nr:DUF6371 domain-containing protein [Flavobacterium resistens]MRX66963.1 hypothetical protein [Flavobacterium resistens]SMO62673.1 hypothetical protein SAMN06265349_102893 [Flavobacterium resistens]